MILLNKANIRRNFKYIKGEEYEKKFNNFCPACVYAGFFRV